MGVRGQNTLLLRIIIFLIFLSYAHITEAIEPPTGFFDIQRRLNLQDLDNTERAVLEQITSAVNLSDKDKLVGLYARKIADNRYEGIFIVEYEVGEQTEHEFLESIYETTSRVLVKAGVAINQLNIFSHLNFQRMDINLPYVNGRKSVMSYLAKKDMDRKLILITVLGENFLTKEVDFLVEQIDL